MEEALGRCTLQGVSVSGKSLGRGAYGGVYEAHYCGMSFAAKEIHPTLIEYSGRTEGERIKEDFMKECYHLSECRHPNIVQFIGIYYPPQRMVPTMIMEEMECNLRELIERESIPFSKILSIIHDVSLGIWYMHNHDSPLMHRDLQPNNVLVNTSPLIAKICDFGVMRAAPAITGRKGLTQAPGSPAFMPPEALSPRPVYGPPLDVFSFGGVTLYATTGEWPIPSDNPSANSSNTRNRVEVERRQQYLDKMKEDVVVLRLLVEECLADDPAMRPTMSSVCERIREVKEGYPVDEVCIYVCTLMFTTCINKLPLKGLYS